MAAIERISMTDSPMIEDRSVPTFEEIVPADQALAGASVEIVRALPGLRISARMSTSSLPDYANFDLNCIRRAASAGTVTDGASS